MIDSQLMHLTIPCLPLVSFSTEKTATFLHLPKIHVELDRDTRFRAASPKVNRPSILRILIHTLTMTRFLLSSLLQLSLTVTTVFLHSSNVSCSLNLTTTLAKNRICQLNSLISPLLRFLCLYSGRIF